MPPNMLTDESSDSPSTRKPIEMKTRYKRQTLQDMTRPLKSWLYRHRDNPYPTKADKMGLATDSNMTLTQVSNWFANARRRLKNTVNNPDLSWGKRVKLYNSCVKGNQELLSISSDDSAWESGDENDHHTAQGSYPTNSEEAMSTDATATEATPTEPMSTEATPSEPMSTDFQHPRLHDVPLLSPQPLNLSHNSSHTSPATTPPPPPPQQMMASPPHSLPSQNPPMTSQPQMMASPLHSMTSQNQLMTSRQHMMTSPPHHPMTSPPRLMASPPPHPHQMMTSPVCEHTTLQQHAQPARSHDSSSAPTPDRPFSPAAHIDEPTPKFKSTILQRYLHDSLSNLSVNPVTGGRHRNPSGSLSSHDFEDLSVSSRSTPTRDLSGEELNQDYEELWKHWPQIENRASDDMYWKEISAALALTALSRGEYRQNTV